MRILLVLFVCAPTLAAAQGNQAILPTTLDARSGAMGRTAILSANGSNAIFSNPALLGFTDAMQVQLGGRLNWGSIDYGVPTDDGEVVDFEARYSLHPRLTHASFSMPYRPGGQPFKAAFGIGYQTFLDLSSTLVQTAEVQDQEAELTQETRGGLNTIGPAVAVSFEDRYVLGVSFHKSLFSNLSADTRIETNGEGPIENDELSLDSKVSGSFLLLGASARVTPALTVAFAYRTAFELTIDAENDDLGNDTETDYPGMWGVAASFQLLPRLLLVGEVQNRPFATFDEGDLGADVDDGYALRLGAELESAVPVRLGVFRDAIPVPGGDGDAPAYLTGVTGGVGLALGELTFDTGLEVTTWKAEEGILFGGGDYSETLFRIYLTARYMLR